MAQVSLVFVESPYAGNNVERNIRYARACVLDCIDRGETPFAAHLFYTQVLDDNHVGERKLGIELGLHWAAVAETTVVYIDLGITEGMIAGMRDAIERTRNLEVRSLKEGTRWSKDFQ